MAYLWSDAWLLQAIVVAAKSGSATLGQVMAAADAINHALPTRDELHGGLARLTAGGFVEDTGRDLRPTALVPAEVRSAIIGSGWKDGRQAATDLLRAEPWTSQTNTRDSRNQVVYAALTPERLREAGA